MIMGKKHRLTGLEVRSILKEKFQVTETEEQKLISRNGLRKDYKNLIQFTEG